MQQTNTPGQFPEPTPLPSPEPCAPSKRDGDGARSPRRSSPAPDRQSIPPRRRTQPLKVETPRHEPTSIYSDKTDTSRLGTCPYPQTVGHHVRASTGEMMPTLRPCMRKLCPTCKHLRYRRRSAHFRDVLSALAGPLLFVTLTAATQDGSVEQAVEEICKRFSRRFVPKLRDMMEATPRRVAQADISPDGRVHLHAVIETTLSAGAVAGAWVRSGGGIDVDVQRVRPTRDDIARVCLYVLKGGLDVRTGRELTSHGIGYDSKVHKDRRRARMAEGADPDLLFEPAEREHSTRTPRSRPAAQDRPATPTPLNDHALSLVAGGRHGIESTFDPATDCVTWTAVRVRGRGGSRRYVALATCASKKHARDYLRRRDARVRSRSLRPTTKP